MELQLAENLAIDLMREHRLVGWTFAFDKAVSRLGVTHFKTNTICLSAQPTELNPESQVRNTILHEIAHALVGPNHHHDFTWYAKAKAIGCTGDRCTNSAIQVKGRWSVKCGYCNTIIHEYHRQPKVSRLLTSWHIKCGRASKGQLQVIAND